MARTSAERSSSEAQRSTARTKPKVPKTPRPTQEVVEINSDDELQPAPRHKGVMRGLDERQILTPAITSQEPPIAISDDDDEDDETATGQQQQKQRKQPPKQSRAMHVTRSARNGRQQDTYEKYNMKFHPMDVITRPANAAKQRSGSRSLSVSTTYKGSASSEASGPSSPRDGETDDESLPSSADSNRDSAAVERNVEISLTREPDPKATRYSKRNQASKFVNYSAKHHPNDDSIVGHKYKAKQLERAQAKQLPSPEPTNSKKRQSAPEKTQVVRKKARKTRATSPAVNMSTELEDDLQRMMEPGDADDTPIIINEANNEPERGDKPNFYDEPEIQDVPEIQGEAEIQDGPEKQDQSDGGNDDEGHDEPSGLNESADHVHATEDTTTSCNVQKVVPTAVMVEPQSSCPEKDEVYGPLELREGLPSMVACGSLVVADNLMQDKSDEAAHSEPEGPKAGESNNHEGDITNSPQADELDEELAVTNELATELDEENQTYEAAMAIPEAQELNDTEPMSEVRSDPVEDFEVTQRSPHNKNEMYATPTSLVLQPVPRSSLNEMPNLGPAQLDGASDKSLSLPTFALSQGPRRSLVPCYDSDSD